MSKFCHAMVETMICPVLGVTMLIPIHALARRVVDISEQDVAFLESIAKNAAVSGYTLQSSMSLTKKLARAGFFDV